MIGQTISHYRILEKLGEGGMGVVYMAHDTALDRVVALKFLAPFLTTDASEKDRFYQEARATAALTHPNIAVVHEIGEHEDQVFIAMEYIEGQSLRDLVGAQHSAPLPMSRILDIAIQICEGLTAAHEKGIVHRDIKSDNIIVTPKGQVKIMDFGLAKMKGATKLTQAGSTVGTAAYMSPEQVQGMDVDHRSDIFSFGVVLYELLTGKLPFRGEHQAALMYSIVNEEPVPIARFNEKAGDDIQRIVDKALAKDSEERYQHVDDLLADLKRERKNLEYVRSGETLQPVEPLRSARRKTMPLLIGLLGIMVLVTAYFAFFKQNEPVRVSTKPSIAVLYLQNLSENRGDEYFAAGMTEDIITQLSKIGGLRVLSRSDVEEFKGKTVRIADVADKLKVNYVMEGSVRKYGDTVRITCQLIKASDGFHIWADSYDRQMEDLFAIQADVAKQVAGALKVSLAPPELAKIEKKPTLNVQAYNYYLQGREEYMNKGDSKASLQLASRMFEKALQADSNFALAYAGLSDCYSYYVIGNIDPKRSWLEKSEKVVLKALALDPTLGEALRALSRIHWAKGKTKEAIQAAEEAVKTNPNYGEAWTILGIWYLSIGQYPEAESILVRSLEVNPTEPNLFGGFIALFSLWGDRKKAEEYFNRALEVQPPNWYTYYEMSLWYSRWGQLKEAKNMAHESLHLNPHTVWALDNLMKIHLLLGQQDSSSFYLNEARREAPERDYFVEMAHLALIKGDKKQAQAYADSCIQINGPLVKEFEGLPDEYVRRLRMATAYALMGESGNALKQTESLQNSLGESVFTVESAYGQELGLPLSFVYSLSGEKEEAMRMLEYLVHINFITPAYIKLHPWYRNLAGHPPFEELIGQEAE